MSETKHECDRQSCTNQATTKIRTAFETGEYKFCDSCTKILDKDFVYMRDFVKT